MKVQTFVNAVNQVMCDHKHVDIIFIILPNQQLELYSAVKKRCCLDFGGRRSLPAQSYLIFIKIMKLFFSLLFPVASQCFLSKHLQPNAKGKLEEFLEFN